MKQIIKTVFCESPDCAACRCCCDNCPAQINIPAFLSVYNSYKTDGPWVLNQLSGVDSVGKPNHCVNSGRQSEFPITILPWAAQARRR